jgi:hypothetical protein
MNRGPSKFGSTARPQTKVEKDMVFIIDIERITPASTKE